MSKQKFNIGQKVILLDAIFKKPVASAEVASYEESTESYRIRYQISGDPTIWIVDVEENRLITFADIVNAVK